MKTLRLTGHGTWLALPLLLASMGSYAGNPITRATQALNCQPESQGKSTQQACPYLTELYDADPVFKNDMTRALEKAGFPDLLGPEGRLNGPEDTLTPMTLNGQTWLLGYICENGSCGDNYLRFLYQPATHQVLGFYYNGTDNWIGSPQKTVANLLQGRPDMPPSAPPPVLASSPDAPPPNTIWTFTNTSGENLWQVCGGQASSCSIIAGTKYYVAVFNRKSAHSCAFGDFYIADKETARWQRYDTGTCSPDAYISKGTFHKGQYLSVDIGVNGVLVKQFPIGYWTMSKAYASRRH